MVGDIPARLRAAAEAGQAAADRLGWGDLDVAAAWEPALSALVDLADVLEPPHDHIAAAIVAALDPTAQRSERTETRED